MATLNPSIINNDANELILSSNIVDGPLPIKTSGQGWPKGGK
jgi:hypothetical protein